MKRLLSIIAMLALLLAIFSGCTKKETGNNNGGSGNQTQQEENNNNSNNNNNNNNNDPIPTDDFNTDYSDDYNDYLDGTPSGGYSKFAEAKYAAYDRVTAKIEENEELIWYSMTLLPFTMIDLSLLSVSALTTTDAATAEMALAFFYEGVDVDISGDTYTISYKDSEGNTYTDTCVYDAKKDTLKANTTNSSGNETLFFEYVKVAEGSYAAQYYYNNEDDGGYEMLTLYFDDGTVGFGSQSMASKPASIFGQTGVGLEIVKGCESYYILDGNSFIVYEDGVERVY